MPHTKTFYLYQFQANSSEIKEYIIKNQLVIHLEGHSKDQVGNGYIAKKNRNTYRSCVQVITIFGLGIFLLQLLAPRINSIVELHFCYLHYICTDQIFYTFYVFFVFFTHFIFLAGANCAALYIGWSQEGKGM